MQIWHKAKLQPKIKACIDAIHIDDWNGPQKVWQQQCPLQHQTTRCLLLKKKNVTIWYFYNCEFFFINFFSTSKLPTASVRYFSKYVVTITMAFIQKKTFYHFNLSEPVFKILTGTKQRPFLVFWKKSVTMKWKWILFEEAEIKSK